MARLLVDEGIGRDLVRALVAQGYTVLHAIDLGLKGAHDAGVFQEAQRRLLTVFTYNRDDCFRAPKYKRSENEGVEYKRYYVQISN